MPGASIMENERGGNKNDPGSFGCQLGHMGMGILPIIIFIIREVVSKCRKLTDRILTKIYGRK